MFCTIFFLRQKMSNCILVFWKKSTEATLKFHNTRMYIYYIKLIFFNDNGHQSLIEGSGLRGRVRQGRRHEFKGGGTLHWAKTSWTLKTLKFEKSGGACPPPALMVVPPLGGGGGVSRICEIYKFICATEHLYYFYINCHSNVISVWYMFTDCFVFFVFLLWNN